MAQVFLLDPDAGIRATLRCALEDDGHTVAEAPGDGHAAVERLRLAPTAMVVLFDYTRVSREGATLVHALGADPVLARQHAYILTTADRPPYPPADADCIAGLALPVVEKPFDLSDPLARVAEAAMAPVTLRCDERVGGGSGGSARHASARKEADQSTPRSRPTTTSQQGGPLAGEPHGTPPTRAVYALARVHAQGVADGSAAAAADSPEYLSYAVMLDTAWEESCDRPDVQPLAEQEEYFVAWVHGYVQRADEIEDASGTWESAT